MVSITIFGVICYLITFVGGLLGVAGIKVGAVMFFIGAGILLIGLFILYLSRKKKLRTPVK